MPVSSQNLKKFKVAAALILLVSASAFAELLPYKSPLPRVPTVWGDATPYDTVLKRTYEGMLKRNVNAYSTGLVHRPKSEVPGDAVSEGVSYGMFLALYSNDQANFNKIWNAGEKYMWNGGGNFYDWRVNSSGTGKLGTGPASDADQDIALLLIFANELVKNKVWNAYTSPESPEKDVTYETRAKSLLGTIRTTMVASNGALLPGHWGEAGIINPGYFAPAFYRVFAEFDSTNKDAWNNLTDACYAMLSLSPGYSRGLIPDWFNFEGKSTGGAGYNAYFDGDALYRDAIRVYWRLGIDYLWYGEPRAKTFLDNAIRFIEGKGGPAAANFYTMAGELLPANDIEALKGKTITRSRREHSQLTAGMWAAAAIGSKDVTLAKKYSDKLLEFYKPGTDYWGHAVDPTPGGGRLIVIDGESVLVPEDTARNEMYFDQFLAWFGASMLAGVFTNVWEDLKDGVPQGPPEWKSRPASLLSNWNIDASKEPFRLGASFNRSVRWTVTLKHDQTGQTVTFGGNSDSVNVVWYGLSAAGAYMPQGWYTLTLSAAGLEYRAKVWLGRPYAGNIPNIRQGNRLLVDDFASGTYTAPYIGNDWRKFLDSFGSSVTPSVEDGGDKKWLRWAYSLSNTGGFPHAGIDWNCGSASSSLDLTGVDSVVVVAKRVDGSVDLGVSVQLVSSDVTSSGQCNYCYFEDSLKLTTAAKEFPLPVSRFKQRINNTGNLIANTLKSMTAVRFHVQTGEGASGTVIIEKMYLTGPDAVLSRIYTPPPPPPAYVEPPHDPEIISVKHRARASAGYSVKRIGGAVRITTPLNMAGSSVTLVNVKGRVVKRLKVPQDGRIEVSARDLAAGMYFVEVRKKGVAGVVRLRLGNVR